MGETNKGIRRVRKRGWSRRAVLESAESVFGKKGYAGANLREIARASGVSQPLINHHFGSKAKLYEELRRELYRSFGEFWAKTRQKREAAGDQSHYEAIFEGLFLFCQKRPAAVRLLLWAGLEGHSLWPERLAAGSVIAAEVSAEQARGTLRSDVPPALLAAMAESLVVCWWQLRDIARAQLPKELAPREVDALFLSHAREVLRRGTRPS